MWGEDIVHACIEIYILRIFDGDILNIIGMMTEEMAYVFRKFHPVDRMIISRDDGMLNPYFDIIKGQLIDLYSFNTL